MLSDASAKDVSSLESLMDTAYKLANFTKLRAKELDALYSEVKGLRLEHEPTDNSVQHTPTSLVAASPLGSPSGASLLRATSSASIQIDQITQNRAYIREIRQAIKGTQTRRTVCSSE